MQKLGKITGTLYEVGQHVARPGEVHYAYLKMEKDDGRITIVERVVIPDTLHHVLETGKPFNFFLARRGLWNFCFAIQARDGTEEAYENYSMYYLLTWAAILIDFVIGGLLVPEPGFRGVGIGHLGARRAGAGGDQKLIEGFLDLPVLFGADRHMLTGRINGDNLMACPDINIIFFAKGFRAACNQLFKIIEQAAKKVGHTAGGI